MVAAEPVRIALAQINTTVGDIDGNAAKVLAWARRASEAGATVTAFPELTLTGYPPEDLLLKRHFLTATREALDQLACEIQDAAQTALVGFAELRDDRVCNSLAVLDGGKVRGIYRKMLLPNYGVFDERRYFTAGERPALIEVSGIGIGLTVCEDIWEASSAPLVGCQRAGASVIINSSASPYHHGKGAQRQEMLASRARDHSAYVALCSLVGGQDELVFDGQSMVVNPAGELIARARQFEQDLIVFAIDPAGTRSVTEATGVDKLYGVNAGSHGPSTVLLPSPGVSPALAPPEEIYRALGLGLRDYAQKNGFEGVVFGLSGGIDSALTACIAVDALGAGNVTCAVMPSPHSSEQTQADARELARRLGIKLFDFSIEPEMDAYSSTLADAFAGAQPGIAEENLQARIRGTLVMALSNKFDWLALSTGNKSEYAVGYTTLYGDMAGGLAVLKDVPKTLVYELARYRNERGGEPPIPQSVIDRAPSAELRPDQRDQDALPPYDLLDGILEAYIESDRGREQLIDSGFDTEIVDQVIALVDHAEYKRRQAPPGIRITPKAFGRDRRLPITNRFRG